MSGAWSSNSPEIVAWLDNAKNPIVTALCELIEAVDPRVVGELKWNAPSYRIVDHFVTTGLLPNKESADKDKNVRLVLHTGATKRPTPLNLREVIDDRNLRLDWKDADRAVLVFRSMEEVEAARTALPGILWKWMELTQRSGNRGVGGTSTKLSPRSRPPAVRK